jgi:transcriptional regulator with GAF, ATPase, and Fis domain
LANDLAVAVVQDIDVLISRGSSTGKSFLASVIHEGSPLKGHGSIVAHYGALVPDLIQSDSFGRRQGPYTGAGRARVGRFAAAGKGIASGREALELEQ